VAQDEMLCELETDKVSVEVPSPAAGTLSEILADEGTTVEANARIAVVASGDTPASAPKAQADPDAHRDLIVRVAGYSDYFCDLSEALQEEIIERTEHATF
jgi:2-oxoglutarate dehydrogenase E2 component (dihydrolipoamide succinyltransferase)